MSKKNAVPTSVEEVEVFAPEVSCDAHEGFDEECEACWEVAEEFYGLQTSSDGSWSEEDDAAEACDKHC